MYLMTVVAAGPNLWAATTVAAIALLLLTIHHVQEHRDS